MMRPIAILCAAIGLVSLLGIPAEAAVFTVPGTHATIQAAVNTAGPGDTINVGAGLFTEAVNVPVGKNGLLIQGANLGVAAGRVPGVRGAESVVDGGFLISSDAVVVDGFTIKNGQILFGGAAGIGGVTIGNGPGTVANVVVRNNIFESNGALCGGGVYPAVHHTAAALGGHLISNNSIGGGWCQGIFLNPSSGNTVEENDIHDNGVGIGSDGQSNFLVQFNNFANNNAFGPEGIGMGAVGTGVVINNNNFAGGDNINHYGPSGAAVDAERNYYGCEEGPGNVGCSTMAGGSFPGDVDFTPWLCTAYPDGTDTNDVLGAACVPPEPLPASGAASVILLSLVLVLMLGGATILRRRKVGV